MKKIRQFFLPIILALCVTMSLNGCTPSNSASVSKGAGTTTESGQSAEAAKEDSAAETPASDEPEESAQTETPAASAPPASVSIDQIPAYSGSPYIAVNNNVPGFSDADLTTTPFENYSELDSLGRCQTAYADVCTDTMPTEPRGEIGSVKPSGWHTVKYDNVDGKYLYNRCHLIGYQLTGENANPKNLITGTRYLNIEGMLPFENMVADYVKETSNHVLYMVIPIFEGDNLVASGVEMEAESVEDKGEGVSFNVYCYNVQPGITIDYASGESAIAEESQADTSDAAEADAESAAAAADTSENTYILNTNTRKFHRTGCSSVNKMSEKNKQTYTGSRDELIAEGYSPCKICNP